MTDLPAAWHAALRQRRELFDLADPHTCLRLLHAEDESMRCDRFGPVCWFYRYAAGMPTRDELSWCESLTSAAGSKHWHVHGMQDRGRDPNSRRHAASAAAPAAWHGDENGLRFGLRAGSGQSPGLFLDQRDNRLWVRQHAEGARILNLFAYTGGFGIAALSGGAEQVFQVDVSRSYLDWARDNTAANDLAHEADRVEYSAVDARLLVAGCRKRGRRFDGIVCDPPSFGRGRGRRDVFRIERDLADLVRACVDLINPGGWLLVSSNYEGWSQARFEATVADSRTTLEPAPGAGADFRSGGSKPLLKSCILRLTR
ncbi:MAG TPA: class I SAM-dependent methyltransferase [Candidatus Latescibacteria bacterium]|nr:hypothetical protein [Gemmatimonadaceae bacterium]MDP6017302.1 class I SAM-dependent methyltransferase [Candidatus Latescibacterota bacterium]HJP32216.1 class I SAM-dependent methyltransferase [Candidatus Latescibacterota bacterium]